MPQQQRQYTLRYGTETDENDFSLEFEIYLIGHFINWCCRFSGSASLAIFVPHEQQNRPYARAGYNVHQINTTPAAEHPQTGANREPTWLK
jgi:hypothetical protein